MRTRQRTDHSGLNGQPAVSAGGPFWTLMRPRWAPPGQQGRTTGRRGQSMSDNWSGEMAEWFKAHAWKACVGNTTGGSNPPLSAT